MSRYLALAVALWLASIPLASAQSRRGESLERAFETSTDATRLPGNAPGTLDARGCLQCPSMSLQVPATARFYVGKDAVTFAEMRNFARAGSYDMVIFYELTSNVVRRIVVSGVLPKQTTN